MRPRILFVAAVAGSTLAMTGCADQPMPGTMLGTFKVDANVKSNTCGAGLGAADPWVFSVQLSRLATTLYWGTMDGRPLLSGALDAQARATLRTTVTANVDGTDAALGPCTMQRTDEIDVALGSGAQPGSFTASFTYAIAPQEGAMCGDQLAASGGMYDALPCTLAYDASASRQ